MEARPVSNVKQRRTWPLLVIALPAAVAVWSGWVGLGELCGFGIIHPLPGIWDNLKLNTAITLPVGVEAYGAYALGIWADIATPKRVRRFAFRSALGSLLLGLLGQVAFHLLAAAGYARAPWPVVVFVSCIPVAALGFGMGLHQLLIHTEADEAAAEPAPVPALSRVAALDALAGTITPRDPEPEPWPDAPARPGDATEPDGVFIPEADDPPAEVHHEEDAPVRPVPDEPPAVSPDELDREVAELFGSAPPAARPEPAPEPARTSRKAAPAGKWTPEGAGLTVEQLRQIITETGGRNRLAARLEVGSSTASRIIREYGQPEPALNGRR
jgi:hypothetical protein